MLSPLLEKEKLKNDTNLGDKEMYLDNSATTQVSEEVFKEMEPYFTKEFGNPSTLYSIGRESKKALNLARQRVADAINAKPEEIIFTSGGSESDRQMELFVNDDWNTTGDIIPIVKKFKHTPRYMLYCPIGNIDRIFDTMAYLDSISTKPAQIIAVNTEFAELYKKDGRFKVSKSGKDYVDNIVVQSFLYSSANSVLTAII